MENGGAHMSDDMRASLRVTTNPESMHLLRTSREIEFLGVHA